MNPLCKNGDTHLGRVNCADDGVPEIPSALFLQPRCDVPPCDEGSTAYSFACDGC